MLLIKMLRMKPNQTAPLVCSACVAVLAICFLSGMAGAASAGGPNLALHKPASASSIENDDQNAAKANDGDDDTRWCADDEPENGAEWWQVDLQKPADLSSCQVIFPYEGKLYRYKVEGSADGKTWIMLSDQSQTTARTRLHNLTFNNAAGLRYVKITILAFDEGCWASISEVRIYGQESASGK